MVNGKRNIEVKLDSETQDYYVIWQPLVIASGGSEVKALQELREAAHSGIDVMIDMKLRELE